MQAASQAVAAAPVVQAPAPPARAHPALWVPSLYFAMGTPMTAVTVMTAVVVLSVCEKAALLNCSVPGADALTAAPLATVERALAIVQDLDPPGVGARNLAECLALQAKAADRYDPAMARLIDNLDLLSKGRTGDLKRICGVDDEDLADMVSELRAYDPKPGSSFIAAGSEQVRMMMRPASVTGLR